MKKATKSKKSMPAWSPERKLNTVKKSIKLNQKALAALEKQEKALTKTVAKAVKKKK